MSEDTYKNSQDRIEDRQVTESGKNHVEGQNNSIVELLFRLKAAHQSIAEQLESLAPLAAHLVPIQEYLVEREKSIIDGLNEMIHDPEDFLTRGFLQYDPTPTPEMIVAHVNLNPPDINADQLEQECLKARDLLIRWTEALTGENMTPSMHDFLEQLQEFQKRERSTLAEGLDSYNKS